MSAGIKPKPDRPHPRYDRLLEAARRLRPVKTAVAHPCDSVSLEGAVEAARLGRAAGEFLVTA